MCDNDWIEIFSKYLAIRFENILRLLNMYLEKSLIKLAEHESKKFKFELCKGHYLHTLRLLRTDSIYHL